MNLSNDSLVAFHYRSYGTFFLQQKRFHNIHRELTHYKYYRAIFLGEIRLTSTLASKVEVTEIFYTTKSGSIIPI